MKNYTRLLTLLLVLVLMLEATASTVLAVAPIEVSSNELYASSQPSSYSSQYNSGKRDVVATTLNGTSAADYYTGSYDFDVLSEKSSSQILSSLRELMTSTHKKNSSYDDCKNMAGKTDCEEENGKVLLLYTSVYSTVSAANNGWNREHVWPKSLGGYNTSGPGADLHHIRPSDNRVNSCRGNLKYGNVTGGKDATGGNAATGISGGTYGSYFEPLDNVKGDVARICLYMYVRYGGMSAYTCSSITKVFQSVDVLLEWCESDPVDTWELGRNEVVEAYQGNRNVFIDYPEYAWLLFGKSVPEDMATPSGEASNGTLGGNGGTTTPDPDPDPDPNPEPEPDPMTDKEILDAAYALAPGASLDGTYTLTGIITALDSYNNPTIVVGNYTDREMYCYRLVDDRFEIGATITVTGTITNYNGLVEMKNCTLESIKLPTDTPNPEPDPNPMTDKEILDAAYALAPGASLDGTYTLTGVITALDSYNNPTIVVGNYTDREMYCYRLVDDRFEIGATITVTGTITNYNGLVEMKDCTLVSIKSPTDTPEPDPKPEPTPDTMTESFEKAVTELGKYLGEELYGKLCDALVIYGNMTDDEKSSVSGKYAELLEAVEKYNSDVADVNASAAETSSTFFGYTIIYPELLCYAAYSLLGKKHI